jgi:hypothetical protein
MVDVVSRRRSVESGAVIATQNAESRPVWGGFLFLVIIVHE